MPKLDGSHRFCADFRSLNDATITNTSPQKPYDIVWIPYKTQNCSLPLICIAAIGRFLLTIVAITKLTFQQNQFITTSV